MKFYKKFSSRTFRVSLVSALAIIVICGLGISSLASKPVSKAIIKPKPGQVLASHALGELAVKPFANGPKYNRTADFASGWASAGGCDMREVILNRDLTNVKDRSANDCTVLRGTLKDPYTGKTINFTRGAGTSNAVQIDHVVALGDAWKTGAQQLSAQTRLQIYDDPLELLAVDGSANTQKSDSDASAWLPTNKAYDCRYVARQIDVKIKYHLWVTYLEHTAMQNVLNTCPAQVLPIVGN
ncbi:MAG: HNH endonuclease family protein [Candidatus Saccharimonadales bacterium]